MIDRHDNEIMLRLEQVLYSGYVQFLKSDIKRWYDRERVTKNVWADILRRWNSITDGAPIIIGDNDGFYVLIYGDKLTVNAGSWWHKLSDWA